MKKKRGFLKPDSVHCLWLLCTDPGWNTASDAPFASRNGQSVNFLDALFTSTSASCVTGLVVRDTWSQWSLFGQL